MEDVLRQKRIDQARIILNHSEFVRKSAEERYQIVKNLVDKGLDEEDIKILKAEADSKSGELRRVLPENFALLDKNVLAQILANLAPREVVSNCGINRQFAHVCRDQDVFKFLLEKHYPYAFVTDNPHGQYVAITEGVETTYAVHPVSVREGKYRTRQIGPPQKPELISGWSLSKVGLGRVLEFINNPIFLGWLDAEDRIYIRQTVMPSVLKLSLTRLQSFTGSEYRKRTYLDLIEKKFKEFLAEYRRIGIKGLLSLEDVRAFMSHHDEREFTSVVEQTEIAIEDFLTKGKPDQYRNYSEGFITVVKGNSIPAGTKTWSIIRPHEERGRILPFETREKMASYFIENYYGDLLASFFKGFFDFDISRHDLVEGQNLTATEEIIKTEMFKTWFRENSKAHPELLDLSKQSVYNYAMTHDDFLASQTSLGTTYFRQITF